MFVFVIMADTPHIILEKVKSLIKKRGSFIKTGQFAREHVNLTYRLKVQSLQLPKSKLSCAANLDSV